MNQRRPPAPPPQLPGFTHLELLGSGGFADVYLYEQELPRRRVAVKVLLPERISASAAQFTAEANVMAMLSTHPAIVTIYQAGVSSDGRPYLVMEYCPRPNLQVRYRREPFSAAEALRVGIQVAAAVETAHRAGVLHRDIKPANILVTEYNRPALTDFGIASTSQSGTEATGMSIPWSPPEAFAADAPGGLAQSGPRTDVYQLGATIYTLLAGRSPFELPGQRNGSAELIERIERMPLPAIDRPDVPTSLYATLARAMAKNPAERYPSAVAFARALQKVQIELAHAVTPIDILDDRPLDAGPEDDDGGLTRVRGITNIAPIDAATRPSATTARTAAGSAPAPVEDDATVIRGPRVVEPVDDATIVRAPARTAPPAAQAPAPAAEPPAPETPRPARRRWPVVVAASIIGVAVVGIAGATIPQMLAPQPEPTGTSDVIVQDPTGGGAVPLVTDGRGVIRGDQAVFSWTNPEPEEGDRYQWHRNTLSGPGESQSTAEPTVTVPLEGAAEVCIDVTLVRADGRFTNEATTICASR